jgi:hypothetical protein
MVAIYEKNTLFSFQIIYWSAFFSKLKLIKLMLNKQLYLAMFSILINTIINFGGPWSETPNTILNEHSNIQ